MEKGSNIEEFKRQVRQMLSTNGTNTGGANSPRLQKEVGFTSCYKGQRKQSKSRQVSINTNGALTTDCGGGGGGINQVFDGDATGAFTQMSRRSR